MNPLRKTQPWKARGNVSPLFTVTQWSARTLYNSILSVGLLFSQPLIANNTKDGSRVWVRGLLTLDSRRVLMVLIIMVKHSGLFLTRTFWLTVLIKYSMGIKSRRT